MAASSAHREPPRARRAAPISQLRTRRLPVLVLTAILGAPWLVAAPSIAIAGTDIVVTTTSMSVSDDGDCSLPEAIYAANFDANIAPSFLDDSFFSTGCAAGSGADTIELPANATFTATTVVDDLHNPFGPTATPLVFSDIVIEGHGSLIQRSGPLMRAFAVGDASVNINPGGSPDLVSGTGSLTIRNLDIRGFFARGGNGGVGAGGGLGAGGAIYVRSGHLTVEGSTLEGNRAEGGNGGTGAHVGGGGGGGGLGGDGGSGVGLVYYFFQTSSGGGGGGARGDGGSAIYTGPDGQVKPASQGGGGGGTVTNGVGTKYPDSFGRAGGEACGGDGGDFNGDGADGCDGGGGGGGGEPYRTILCTTDGGGAGTGGYGGGGGGGGYGDFFNFVCPDIVGRSGGHGGFGGGGGAGGTEHGGGGGGFGAGGGGGDADDGGGAGGTFGGHGGKDAESLTFAVTGAGGGGAGLGGAIFSDRGTVTVRNSTFTGNSVSHGFAGSQGDATTGASNGADAGGAIFAVDGSLTVRNATISGNESTGSDAGLAVYRSTRDGSSAALVLTNTIVAGNTPTHLECELLGSVTASGAGNLVTDNADCPGVAVTDDPGLAGLSSQPPGSTPTMAIDANSSAYHAGNDATCEPFDQRGVSRANPGCDIGAYQFSSDPPTTTIALAPAAPNGSNGWYVSPVAVTLTASDPDSTVAQTRCVLDPSAAPTSFSDLPSGQCAITSIGSDGSHALYAASVDGEGNEESPIVSGTLSVDRTKPTLSPSLNVGSPITVGQTGVSATPGAADATSGLASSGCDAVDTSTSGSHTVACRAADNAGNTNTASVTFVVEYRILGFFTPAPSSKWKVGQNVPIKVALANAAGVRVGDADGAALAAACRVTFVGTGAQAHGPVCLKYDALNDQFVYTWKLAKSGTGPETISARVSYPNTTTTTTKSETVTITR